MAGGRLMTAGAWLRGLRLTLAALALVSGRVFAADRESAAVERLMRDCIIAKVAFTGDENLCDVARFFMNCPETSKVFSRAGKTLSIRVLQGKDWKMAANGVRRPPPLGEPYVVEHVALYHALKTICWHMGYRIRLDGGVVYLENNTAVSRKSRCWTSVGGRQMRGRWVGLLANGKGVVVLRDGDNDYIYTLYERLSAADLEVVKNRVDCDFMPYYYLYGDRWRLRQDWRLRSADEAQSEQEYIYRAVRIIEGRSFFSRQRYKVFQSCEGGALCLRWTGDDYDGELFFLLGENLADDDTFTSERLFWVGTHTYETVKGTSRTVNVYCVGDIYGAVDLVRYSQGLYDKGDPAFDDNAAPERTGGSDGGVLADGADCFGSGSGVIISEDGYLLTNAHVVRKATKVRVKTVKGVVSAKVVRQDPDNDLALLKIEGEYRPIRFSSRRQENLGATVFTLGFPRPDLQGFEPKVTKGVVSGLEGYLGNVRCYQIDAAIQPGNSGGLLADAQGNLVGIVVSSLVGTDEAPSQSVNYAIKKSYVQAFVDSVAGCTVKDQETETSCESLEAAVAAVRESCVMILVYR